MNSNKQVVYIYRINQVDYTQQVKLIANKLNEWKPTVTISEENNIGTVVNELLKKEYKGNIKTVNLDNTLKKEIIEDLCVAFEQNLIGIPDDEVLIRELQAFTCSYNPNTQTVKYSAPSGLHDDCVISLAYAYHAVKINAGNFRMAIIK
jgi:phage FluMu gp28-like protein